MLTLDFIIDERADEALRAMKAAWSGKSTRFTGKSFEAAGNTMLPTPLQSPHPGGILVGMCDGSVQFISGTTDLAILLRLAIKDDGQQVKLNN